MNDRKRYKGSLLVVAGAVLILLIVVLLISLRGPLTPVPPPAPGETDTEDRPATRGLGRPFSSPTDRKEGPEHATMRPAADGGSDASGATSPPADSGPADQAGDHPPAPPIPSTARAAAPPAIPSAIREEKDPARRAELMKLHTLSTARVRVSRLKRRARLLQSSISQAERDGSWSEEKLQQARERLRDISGTIPQAEQELQRIQQEVAGGESSAPAQ